MYKSPIKLTEKPIAEQIVHKIDETIITEIREIGINVDKAELIKALNYDRKQYEKGYAEGYKKGYENTQEDKNNKGLKQILFARGGGFVVGHLNKIDNCDVTAVFHKTTNYDRIHMMTPDELAEFLGDTGICKMCIYGEHGCGKDIRMNCKNGIKKWLESEAENE